MSAEITEVPEKQQFEIFVDDERVGYSLYRDTETQGVPQRIFHHTRIYDTYSGRGLASDLTREAMTQTVAAGRRIVAVCPYVKTWLERNDEFAAEADPVAPAHLQLIDRAGVRD